MSDDSIIIENHGKWDWTLYVDEEGVHAAKPIPYDGVLYYSTKERHVSRKRNSKYGLSLDAVLDYYLRKSDTEMTVGQLIGAVREAQRELEEDDGQDTVECPECSDDVVPSVSVYRDPRTGRDHRQTTCPNCGERIPDADTGRMV